MPLKRLIAGLLLSCVACGAAQADPAGAISRSDFQSALTSYFPDNNVGAIAPSDVRNAFTSLSNSSYLWVTDTTVARTDELNTFALGLRSLGAIDIFGTFTTNSNFEGLDISWDSGNSRYQIVTAAAGAGSQRPLLLQGNGGVAALFTSCLSLGGASCNTDALAVTGDASFSGAISALNPTFIDLNVVHPTRPFIYMSATSLGSDKGASAWQVIDSSGTIHWSLFNDLGTLYNDVLSITRTGYVPQLVAFTVPITASSFNGLTVTSSTGTLTVTNAKTLSVAKTLTLTGTDSTTMTFPTTSAAIARTDAGQTFTGTQTIGALVATTINGNTFTAGTATLTLAGNLITTGAFNTTFIQGASVSITLPTTTSTLAIKSGAQTFVGLQTIPTLNLSAIATSAGANGLYVCIDDAGLTYKKSSCP